MKIMITGGLGFIGSHLAESLIDEKHQIVLLTKSNSKIKNIEHFANKVLIKEIDLTNFDMLDSCLEENKPDIIIHLAGQTSHSKSFENPFYDLDINTKVSLFFLEKIRTFKHKCRFILGSTFIVVGKPNNLPIDETTSCNPTTLYGVNRLTSEQYCKIYNNIYNLDIVTFRITNSFGPREQIIPNKNAINYLMYKAFKGEKITIYDKGNFFRDIIYVSDVVSGIKTIMNNGISGNLYWISSGEKTWFYQLGGWLEDLTGSKVEFIDTPTYTKKVDVGNFLVDNTKLKKLGWEPKIKIKDGIKLTLDYFKQMNL